MPHPSRPRSRAPAGHNGPHRRSALGVEQLEDRVVPTVVFRPKFGPESLSASPPFDVLDSPKVYFVFWGSSWAPGQPGAATEQSLLADAIKVIQGPYLSGLQEYGSNGRAAYGGAWIDASSEPPAGFDPGELDVPSNFAAVQGEIERAIDTPGSPIPAPGSPASLRQAPIYVVVADPPHSSGDQGGWNTPGTYLPPGPTAQGVPVHMIGVGTASGGQGLENEFDLTISHELAETMSDPLEDGSGVEVQPPVGFPAALFPGAQIADNEPVEYGYRLGGPGAPLGQAYWSEQAGAFIVPDGNTGRVELDPTPGWTIDSANDAYNFRPVYDLILRGDQLGTSGRATITIDASASGTAVTVLGPGASPNPQTFFFDAGTIRTINVEPAPAGDTIDVEELTAGQTVNVEGTGPATVNVGAAGSLAGFLGALSVSGRPGSVTLNVDDSQDATGQTFIQGAGPTAGTYTLSRRGRGTVTYAAAALHALTLQGGLAGTAFYLQATAPGRTTTIDTGSGSDLIDVRATSGPLDVVSSGSGSAARQARDTVLVGNPTAAGRTLATIAGAVSVSNRAGTTALVVDDSGDTGGLNLTLTAGALSPTPGSRGPAAIGYGPGVASLQVRAGGGKNAFHVLGTGPASTIDAGTGSDVITVGDAGHNLMAVGNLTVVGNGKTALTVDDRGNLPAQAASPQYVPVQTRYVVSAGRLARTALADTGPSGAPLTSSRTVIGYRGLAGLTIDGGPAAPSTFQIDGTGGAAALTVSAANADVVSVGEPRGTLDAVGNVTINGDGRTTLTVNDDGTAARQQYDVAAGAITRAPLSTPARAPTQAIAFANLANVTVHGGRGADLFAVTGTAPGVAVALYGGPGPNQFLVGSSSGSLDPIQGPLALHGGSRADVAVVNDSGNVAAHRYTLADNGVARSRMAPVTYDGLGEVELFTRSNPAPRSGPDAVSVLSTAANALTAVAVGAGATVTLGAPSGGGSAHTLQGFGGALRVQTPTAQPATVVIDDAGHVGPTGNPDTASRTVTLARDPHAGYFLAGLTRQPIYLQLGTRSSVSVRGDAGNERFVMQSLPPGVQLRIDGGGGTNALDYSAYAGNVTVDLALGTATGLSGGIGNIHGVIGSAGNDVLVGDGVPDALSGGTGRNLLIGGGGADRLTGGDGDDILIGGTTSYDRVPADLALVLREWLQPSGFTTRKAALTTGTDLLAGTGVKLDRTTVQPNAAADVVLPGPGNNWVLP
jgi:hypothetical protein